MKHNILKFVFIIFSVLAAFQCYSQSSNDSAKIESDSIKLSAAPLPYTRHGNGSNHVQERDLGDVAHKIFWPNAPIQNPAEQRRDTRRHFSVVPAAGYTLQTGWAGAISTNMAYYSDTLPAGKLSSVSTSFTYSQYNQTIIPFQANIWSKGNDYNFITELRFISYPSSIYGLGGAYRP